MTPAEGMSYAVKAVVSHVLYYTGVLQLLQRIVLRRKAVVLMYHRVLSPKEQRSTGSHPGIIVSVTTFEKHMALLKRRFSVLTLDQFADRLARRQPFDPSSCLITFDDGWRDNLTNALPILRKEALPALVFLPVNFIGRRRLFPREALTHLLVEAVMAIRKDRSRTKRLHDLLEPLALHEVLATSDVDPLPAVTQALAAHRHMSGPRIEGLVTLLMAELAVGIDALGGGDAFVNWDEVETMARHGVVFGGHGAEHHVLTTTTPDVVDAEIRTSKDVLDARFGRVLPSFAYPGGGWNAAIADRVSKAGYRLAFTTMPGRVGCRDNPFTLHRLNIHEGVTNSAPMFLARLVGLF